MVRIYGMWLLKRKSFYSSTEIVTNVCSSRGLFAVKEERESINQDDFNKAVRKVAESKKLEGKLEYQKL